jgi:hypothetical protein
LAFLNIFKVGIQFQPPTNFENIRFQPVFYFQYL